MSNEEVLEKEAESSEETIKRIPSHGEGAPLRKGRGLNPFIMVILSFVIVILVGTLVLYMPFSQTSKSWSNFGGDSASYWYKNLIDCFFTATSATCVTGLNVFPNGIGADLTLVGQIAVLLMIQIGGLGFITVLAFLLSIFARKMKFKNRLFLMQATGSTSFAHVFSFVRKIILVSLVVETFSTIILYPVFRLVDGDGAKAVWYSLFHSVSSFNNAGFDVLGADSLIISDTNWVGALPHWAYIYLLVITMLEVVIGGLSFLVIFDILSFKRPSKWRAFTKIVLCTTGFLLVAGTLLFVLFDCFKDTNQMTFLEAIFQSVTCRTAGFAVYDQSDLSVGGKIVSIVLMFIGGSPMSTAGGIKTTTIFMVFLSLSSYITGRTLHAFKREYSTTMALKALSLISTAIIIVLICYGIIAAIETSNQIWSSNDIDLSGVLLFEVFSAFGTVGLSQNVTTHLLPGSKLILCILMFSGRLGPMTMFQVFQTNMNKQSKVHYKFVEEDFLIG